MRRKPLLVAICPGWRGRRVARGRAGPPDIHSRPSARRPLPRLARAAGAFPVVSDSWYLVDGSAR
eukprot:2791927-Lingulodinium_polyedra.AAC.1